MIVRSPKFDFTKTTPRWARSLEFSHLFNAMSMLFPPLERHLNRVMGMARDLIEGNDAQSVHIREQINVFMRQEGVHYRIHTAFNRMLARHGFDQLPEFEAELDREYGEYLQNKSLRFLVGYCEGFEILGPIYARIWLDEIGDLFQGAEPNAAAMWKWHISEEFEHRTVCFDVYQRLYGGYFYRLYTMYASQRHQQAFIRRVMDYLLTKEWSQMTDAERAASKKRLKALGRRMQRLALWGLLRVHLPGYNPRALPPPRNFPSALGEIMNTY